LGRLILTLADAAVDDQFADAECKEGSEIVVVGTAATLPDAICGSVSWFVEVDRDLITFANPFIADLARRFAK
jgi:hypothetical protein